MNPFKLGRKHFWQGKIGENPFEPNTTKQRNYDFAFNQAYFENLERVQAKERKLGETQSNNS